MLLTRALLLRAEREVREKNLGRITVDNVRLLDLLAVLPRCELRRRRNADRPPPPLSSSP
jgi:hypothetical protein